tara:strand:- start:536 stop:940 length:405 start_codon:yes stop_codon:yes gene_type:complete
MAAGKPSNWKKLSQNLRLAMYPLHLDELKEAIEAPGCHPDIWILEPDITPLLYLVKNTIPSKTMIVDDDDGTAAAHMLIEAGANVLHKAGDKKHTVLQTAHRYLEGKEHRYPKLFSLLNEADANARKADAGAVQ